MRIYQEHGGGRLEKLVCNQCGREILLTGGYAREGVCSLDILWGYFSEKDGEKHRIDLCEDCYNRWTAGFAVPLEVLDHTELL